jgi:hypothetical protein
VVAVSLHVQLAIVTNDPMRGSERFVKEQVEHVDLSFIVRE